MHKISILLLLVCLICSCVGIPKTVHKTNETTDSPIQPISIEFHGITAGDSLSPAAAGQMEAINGYLASRLTESPYYQVVMTDQERILTGKISRIEEKYQLNLNMIRYETTELENSVSVSFLSLSEFDYAVDLAVAKLEGRDIGISGTVVPPALTLPTDIDSPRIDLAIPEVGEAESDDDIRRISGMLNEQLSQGDYKLSHGEYIQAGEIYTRFLRRFDEGISSEYREKLQPIRDYAERQRNQAEALALHREWSRNLTAIEESYRAGDAPEAVYSGLRELKKTAEEKGRPFLESDTSYTYVAGLTGRIDTVRSVVFASCLDDSMEEVKKLLYEEAYFQAWNLLNESYQTLQEEKLAEALEGYAQVLRENLRKIRGVCDNILEAKQKEFLYDISYYGFNEDRESLSTTFLDYKDFLVHIPYESRRYRVTYNQKRAEYGLQITPVQIDLDDLNSVIFLMNIFGYDVFQDPVLLDSVIRHPMETPISQDDLFIYLDSFREKAESDFITEKDINYLDYLKTYQLTSADPRSPSRRQVDGFQDFDSIFQHYGTVVYIDKYVPASGVFPRYQLAPEEFCNWFKAQGYPGFSGLLQEMPHHFPYHYVRVSRFFNIEIPYQGYDGYHLPWVLIRTNYPYNGSQSGFYSLIHISERGVEIHPVPLDPFPLIEVSYTHDGRLVFYSPFEKGWKSGCLYMSIDDGTVERRKRLAKNEWYYRSFGSETIEIETDSMESPLFPESYFMTER